MPELPEVETVRMGLNQTIRNKEIADVKVIWSKSLVAKPAEVKGHIIGQKVHGVERRGKVLIIELSNDYYLLIHLKMTGQLVVDEAKSKKQKVKRVRALTTNSKLLSTAPIGRYAGGHPSKSMTNDLPDNSTRVIFEFTDGTVLYFNDQRKFGWIKLVPKALVMADPLLARLGPEPLTETFVFADFYTSVSKRQAPIKAVILDQSTVAGIGNIYADEALHLAKIHPATKASTISKPRLNNLYEAIITVLKAAIGYGGTSFTNYVNALGVKGNYLEYARVFRRTGLPCPFCGTPISKIRVAGRGTHFCPKCQKPSTTFVTKSSKIARTGRERDVT